MAALTPYTYIQCPCSDSPTLGRPSGAASPSGAEPDEDDRTFDPRAPRSNFSLYPLEYLLYCEDCHQIRCPRCVAEEIVTYYCPNCLFEVPSSNLKSEGNRSVARRPRCACARPHPSSSLTSSSPLPDAPAAASSARSASALFPSRASRRSPTRACWPPPTMPPPRSPGPTSSPAPTATGAPPRSASALRSRTASTRSWPGCGTAAPPG